MPLFPTYPAGAGATPVRQSFVPASSSPIGGPGYAVASLTIPAGALSGSTAVNLAAAGLIECQSALINNSANQAPIFVTVGSNFAWRVAGGGVQIVPTYWNGGIIYIEAQISTAQLSDIIVQIGLFNVSQPLANLGSMGVQGSQGSGSQLEITPTKLGSMIYNASIVPAIYPKVTTVDLTSLTNIQMVYIVANASNTGTIFLYMKSPILNKLKGYNSLAPGGSERWGNPGVILGGDPSTLLLGVSASIATQSVGITVWGY